MGLLHLDKIVDDIVDAAPALLVAGLSVHQRERREIMTERVAGDRVAFPAAIDFALGLEAGALAVIVEQPVRLQPVQVRAVRLDRSEGRRVGEEGGRLVRSWWSAEI